MGCGNSIPASAERGLRKLVLATTSSNSSPLSAPKKHGKVSSSCDHNKLMEEWQVENKLGEGSFALVYSVRNTESNECAALKVPKSSCDVRKGIEEAKIWRRAGRHQHIVSLMDELIVDGVQVMLMEQCEHCLSEYIHEMQTPCEVTLARMFHQMTSAIAHLQSLSIAHRDIKPDNYLCSCAGVVKLCDFGLADIVPASDQLFGKFGTPRFMSPEMVGDGPHNSQTDVWSLGASCYLILFRECPYLPCTGSARAVMKAIYTNHPKPSYEGTDNVSHVAKEFVAALLNRRASKRVSAKEALELPFVNSTIDQHRVKICDTLSTEMLDEVGSQSTRSPEDSIPLTCCSSSQASATRSIKITTSL